ncbi:sigma-70 family RNA polymerase sigma factor [Gordonia jinhuaensis]|uniref:DNA-directed RNA polymerase sigma-70 factor n=1 Tax=Gordonia jinhuaensis TaxID=1517702 RepID=A0A916X0K9_9ACTN|nr:sigma-70 family RNA polymerase sigma factor [Gordonia jinhuaensis]GGB45508.1 DNA-directed RNA polymerase sigma-70 factor [Gordonia jinhuaensis]
MDTTAAFEGERDRLVSVASRILGDSSEAEDIIQQAWLRLDANTRSGERAPIDNVAAWLTTVVTRLCVDRLRARVPEPAEQTDAASAGDVDPADQTALAETVGTALSAVLDRLSPAERVAFVMHDSFGFEFATIAAALDVTPTAARKLASRARARVRQPGADDALADWEIVDAFMSAARDGDFERLLDLLAPEAVVDADADAISMGTPTHIQGRRAIAEFFNSAAKAALAVFVGDRPGSAWYQRGAAMVAFDFDITDTTISRITFRAEPQMLATVTRRDGALPHL